jgi:hypothetical protein
MKSGSNNSQQQQVLLIAGYFHENQKTQDTITLPDNESVSVLLVRTGEFGSTTVLHRGHLIISGGDGDSSVRIMNPTSPRNVLLLPPMRQARWCHTVLMVSDFIFICGGDNDGEDPLTTEYFDLKRPQSGWRTIHGM